MAADRKRRMWQGGTKRLKTAPWKRLTLMAGGAAALGIAAGDLTTDAMRAQGPSLMAGLSMSWTADQAGFEAFDVAEADRGRSWASMAFMAGLKNCPDPTPTFHAACEARMIEEADAAEALARWRAAQPPTPDINFAPEAAWEVASFGEEAPGWAQLRDEAARQLEQPTAEHHSAPVIEVVQPPQGQAAAPAPAWTHWAKPLAPTTVAADDASASSESELAAAPALSF